MRSQPSRGIAAAIMALAMTVPGVSRAEPLKPFGDSLHEYGVETTRAGLIRALRHAEPEVRELAALKLAEDDVQEARGELLSLLQSPIDTRTEIAVSYALAVLGEEVGRTRLASICESDGAPVGRLDAARKLALLEDTSCLPSLLPLLKSDDADEEIRVRIISLVARDWPRSGEERTQVGRAVAEQLRRTEPRVQMAAASAIRELGFTEATPILEEAIRRQEDAAVRGFLEVERNRLVRLTNDDP